MFEVFVVNVSRDHVAPLIYIRIRFALLGYGCLCNVLVHVREELISIRLLFFMYLKISLILQHRVPIFCP